MATWSDAFSGRSTCYLYLDVSESSTNSGANTSVVSWTLRVTGNNASYALDNVQTYSVNINGSTYSGNWNYDFRSANSKTLRSGTTTVTHNADGSKSISVSGTATDVTGNLGVATITSKTFTLSDFVRLPGAPGAPGLSRSSDGGTIYISGAGASSPVGIDDYNWRWSYDNANWSGSYAMGTGLSASNSGYVPTASVWVQTIAHSSEGWGPWGASNGIIGIPSAPNAISWSRSGHDVSVTVGSSSGSAIDAYYLRWYAYNGGPTWSSPVSVSPGVPYTFTGLAPALTYYFQAWSHNYIGNSDQTQSDGVFVPAGGKRWDGAAWQYATTGKRWDGTNWVDLQTAKRWDGANWVDLA